MTKSKKGWSRRRRKQQACNARRNKPWTKSTGPKSEAGKRIASMNAWKHGHFSASYKMLRAALQVNKDFLRYASLFAAFEIRQQEIMARRADVKRTERNPNEIKGDPPP